jgi:hypothetical protein
MPEILDYDACVYGYVCDHACSRSFSILKSLLLNENTPVRKNTLAFSFYFDYFQIISRFVILLGSRPVVWVFWRRRKQEGHSKSGKFTNCKHLLEGNWVCSFIQHNWSCICVSFRARRNARNRLQFTKFCYPWVSLTLVCNSWKITKLSEFQKTFSYKEHESWVKWAVEEWRVSDYSSLRFLWDLGF